ncbi:MAG: restriction endonuclease [Acidobacteria bacterium]|nr:restriction endonuclease [Acidobacteriota bacterium]
MNTPESFEQQIHRIHELLEGSEAVVTWDDHLSDPDNPCQPRQVDITIRKAGRLTLVECRLHRNRQNVKWIEELIGRRLSLGANSVIAVSSSGFTKGALRKAGRFGIILRDLNALTDEEILNWGRSVALTLIFYQYSNPRLALIFNGGSLPKLDEDGLRSELKSHPVLQSAFNAAAKQLTTLVTVPRLNKEAKFKLRLVPEELCIGGEPVAAIEFSGNARLVTRELVCPVVQGYGSPEVTLK